MTLPERYEHATRGSYVNGCRCQECRTAAARYVTQWNTRAGEAAAARATGEVRPMTKSGRTYKRSCIGPDGTGCPRQAALRKDSKGDVCSDCRLKLPEVWNGLVDAMEARRHLRKLSRRGMGYKQVALAAGVAKTVVFQIMTGAKTRVRNQTARAILAVRYQALGEATLVNAKPTWRRIRWLLDEGFTKSDIALRLGRKTRALQIRHDRITAKTAMQVEKLFRMVNDETLRPSLQLRHRPTRNLLRR